ncbi:hypothetical protein [Erwinia phage vB_Ea_2910A]|nr:hypothetical protein [Erwinia phage vB_Ea_2910A]
MTPEHEANPKLKRVLFSIVRELEKISAVAWYVSKDEKDACGVICPSSIPDWSDEALIVEIERRTLQIEERKRYIAGLHGGAESHQRAAEYRADELYQKYCSKK